MVFEISKEWLFVIVVWHLVKYLHRVQFTKNKDKEQLARAIEAVQNRGSVMHQSNNIVYQWWEANMKLMSIKQKLSAGLALVEDGKGIRASAVEVGISYGISLFLKKKWKVILEKCSGSQLLPHGNNNV